jgi:hypothetical protein
MADEEEIRTLRLKNGAQVNPRVAYVAWRMLGALHEGRPDECFALFALARDGNATCSREKLVELRQRHRYWFTDDGTIDPVTRDVLLSAVRESPEGVVVVNPFQLANEVEKQILLNVQAQDDLLLRRLVGRDKPPGQSIR